MSYVPMPTLGPWMAWTESPPVWLGAGCVAYYLLYRMAFEQGFLDWAMKLTCP